MAGADLTERVVLLGGGKMGGALLRGWLAGGFAPGQILVVEPSPAPELSMLADHHGFDMFAAMPQGLRPSALVLAVKPQVVAQAVAGFATSIGGETLVLSVMAGTTIASLRALLPGAGAFVRAMPNLATAVGRGATAAIADAGCPVDKILLTDRLLSGVGSLEWLDSEALVDTATAVCGSGLAYVFHIVECLAHAGTKAGLPADIAERLARATVAGAGGLLHANMRSATQLREDVTSPGGTTQAGLAVLMAGGTLQALIDDAVEAAAHRAQELGGASR